MMCEVRMSDFHVDTHLTNDATLNLHDLVMAIA
jgi:hypothetical protein